MARKTSYPFGITKKIGPLIINAFQAGTWKFLHRHASVVEKLQTSNSNQRRRGRISLFGQGTLIFSSAKSEIFVDQPDPMEKKLR